MNYGRTPQQKYVFALLIIFFVFTTIIAALSTGTYESGDSIQHYLIARYSFNYPKLFFDHWGKPFFTLLISPFAQFGFLGVCIFNIFCATLSGFLAFKIAEKLDLSNPWMAPVFILFAPIYYVTLVSALTEPLFALIILAGLFFCLQNKFALSGIIVSFLPYVRSEGFLILVPFALVFIYNKKYISCLLIFTGTLLYSVAGLIYYHNLFWIWAENPYKTNSEIYGSGSLFHFVNKNEFILGTPLVVLFGLGVAGYFIRRTKYAVTELLLIPGVFLIYFAAHSFIWWKGLFSSSGLIRVIAGVTPVAGFVAMRGYELLQTGFQQTRIDKKKGVKKMFALIILLLIMWMPFKQHQFPRHLGYEDKIVQQAAGWIKMNIPFGSKYYYQYPYLSIFLAIDPFNEKQYIPLWSLDIQTAPSGSVIIWDNHYGPNESKLPLNTLLANSKLELLQKFKGTVAETPGDKPIFELYVFKVK